MIDHQHDLNQLPTELKSAFQELNIMKYLRQAGFCKRFGFSCFRLFQLVFVLLFHQKSWFRLLESSKGDSFPGKDAVYRFLNNTGFLTSLSVATVQKVSVLTSADRDSVFIVDDSMFERNRSKAVELLARFKDHATGAYYKGFRMLTMGWSDGHTFLPLDFATQFQLLGDQRHKREHRQADTWLQAPLGSATVGSTSNRIHAGSCFGSRSYCFLRIDGQLVHACTAHWRNRCPCAERDRHGQECQ